MHVNDLPTLRKIAQLDIHDEKAQYILAETVETAPKSLIVFLLQQSVDGAGDYAKTGIDELKAKLTKYQVSDQLFLADKALKAVERSLGIVASVNTSTGEVPAATPQQVSPHATTPPPTVAADAVSALAAAMRQIAAGAIPQAAPIDEARIVELIETHAKPITHTQTVVINAATQQAKTLIGRKHPHFEKILRCVAAGMNVMLVGPAGSGKTTIAEQCAKALGSEYGTLHCSAGASESQLLGWLLPTDGGAFEHRHAPFSRLYGTDNSLFLLDECDAADPNMLMVIQGALANGHLTIPQRTHESVITRGANAKIMAAMNTYGTGADTMYTARGALDAAFLNRFGAQFYIDYDRETEREIAEQHGLKTEHLNKIWAIREQVAHGKLRRVISTRNIINAAIAINKCGMTWDECVTLSLCAGWTAQELTKCGLN